MDENQKQLNRDYLLEMLEKQYEKQDIDRILNGYKSKRIVSLRINTIKASIEEIKQKLKNEGVDFETVSWSDSALIIKAKSEADLQELDMYDNGEIYLQNLSSMLPPIVLQPHTHTLKVSIPP